MSVARIGKTDIPIVFAIRTIDTDSRSQIYSIATKESPTILRGDGTQNQSANAHPSYEESSGYGNKVTPSSGVVNDEYSQNQKRTQTLTDRDVLSVTVDKILASDTIPLDAAESDALGIFKKRLATLDSLQKQRRELGRTYKELHSDGIGQHPGKCGKAGSACAQMAGKDAGCQFDGGGECKGASGGRQFDGLKLNAPPGN